MNEYAVMVLSCDSYKDVWPIFIKQFKKYWKEFEGTFFFNTETDRSLKDDTLQITFPDKTYDTRKNWAGRFKDCLKQIEEEYVLVLLDDFVFTGQIDAAEIDKCLTIMKGDHSIACFNFRCIPGPFDGEILGKYVLANKKAEFRINLQAALWKKSFLMKFIRKHENPWQFETWGSIRSRRFKDKLYHIKYGVESPIQYPGGGILADKRWHNQENVEWLRREGYDIDFSKRGVYNDGDPRVTEIVHRSFWEKCWQVFKSLI